MHKTRRFIAGALCPECGKMDKLTVSPTQQGPLQECVACGFVKLLEGAPHRTTTGIFSISSG